MLRFADMNYKIEKNVPEPNLKKGMRDSYPLGDMKVGDSFAIPIKTELEYHQTRARIYTAVSYFAKRHDGFKFTIRKTSEGFRVWRVASGKTVAAKHKRAKVKS